MKTDKRKEFGQVFTPTHIAEFMGTFFKGNFSDIKLLDAGAGTGSLFSTLIKHICSNNRYTKRITLTTYEIDSALIDELKQSINNCEAECQKAGIDFSSYIHNEDFVQSAVSMVDSLFNTSIKRFNTVIVNPPYRKIRSDSRYRLMLRSIGIETSNLYSGFLSLLFRLLEDGGEIVAIIPRSFCNGPYFKPFRVELLETLSLRRIHVFESRSAVFGEDNVLQENIIFYAVKSKVKPKYVTISTSNGKPGSPIKQRNCDYSEIVSPTDPDRFIHIITDEKQEMIRNRIKRFSHSLRDIGLEVSTGRVVDFRAREFLQFLPESGTVPLIYPCHFNGTFIDWPKLNGNKPNSIINDQNTRNSLIPEGIYVLTKRFTSKEEKRRIVACIYDPKRIRSPFIGVENHLNYFHAKGESLSMLMAKGLAAFLNSTMVDQYFRQFNGHTQVNATDLRNLRYPSRRELEKLGKMFEDKLPCQEELSEIIEKELE
ncbi:MAG: Eco57I restriction-modification methylase domain-containing protein [Candidatus Omnitrophota bacterium]